MTEALSALNKQLIDSNIDLIQYPPNFPSFPADSAPSFYSGIINNVDGLINVYYLQNILRLRLQTVELDAVFDTFINDVIEIKAFFKISNAETNPALIYNNFYVKTLNRNLTSLTGFAAEVEFDPGDIDSIRSFFSTSGVEFPHYGVLQFSILLSDGSNATYACKVCTDPLFSPRPVETPAPSINSYTTPGRTFESLFVPEISASFVYNFFESNEEDEVVYRKKDYNRFSVNDIPKFVKLTWSNAPQTPQERGGGGSVQVGGLSFSEHVVDIAPPIAPSAASGGTFDISDRFTGGTPPPTPPADSPFTVHVPTLETGVPIPIALGAAKSEYVGYVILKEKLDQETGEYVTSDIIVINNVKRTQFFDWKVGYGEVYRYKIKSLYRFVDKNGVSIYEDSDSTLNREQELQLFGSRTINAFLYFFDSEYSLPQTVSCVDVVRPEHPQQFLIFPNSQNRNIVLLWNQKNPNLDVVGYNVYKKNLNSKDVFKKCNSTMLGIRQNVYIDYDVEIDREYVYAIESVDVHGNFSTLSIQLIAKIINFDIDIGRNEEKPKFYAYAGLELNERSPVEKNTKYTYFKNAFRVKINPAFTEEAVDKQFILRILSLDTLITKEIKMKFNLSSIYYRIPGTVKSDVSSVVGPNIAGGQDIVVIEQNVGGVAATSATGRAVGELGRSGLIGI